MSFDIADLPLMLWECSCGHFVVARLEFETLADTVELKAMMARMEKRPCLRCLPKSSGAQEAFDPRVILDILP